MRGRAAWLASAVLLLCAGLAAGWATYLSWRSCRGAMLVGTAWDPGDVEVPQACYDRMDQGFPYDVATLDAAAPDFTAMALLAAALAWLVLVIGMPWSRTERWCVLPLAVVLGLASVWAWLPGLAAGFSIPGTLLLIDVATVLAGVALMRRLARGDHVMWRVWVPLLAVGTLGLIARLAEYLVMTMWSELNWDTPPGTGYLGAAVLVLAAIVMAVLTPGDKPLLSSATEDHRQRTSPEVGSLPA